MPTWNTSSEHELATTLTVDEFLNKPETLAWEKLPHESMKAYRAFCVYRDAGRKRSITYVRGRGVGVSNVWVEQYRWTLRTRLYDEYQLAQEQIEAQKLNRELRARQAKQAAEALEGLMAPFKEFQRRLETDEDAEDLQAELAAMPASKLVSTMQASARVLQPLMSAERLAHDLPTEMVENTIDAQLTIQDNRQALTDVLTVLNETGIADALFGGGQTIEALVTSDEQVDPNQATPEAASLPAGPPA